MKQETIKIFEEVYDMPKNTKPQEKPFVVTDEVLIGTVQLSTTQRIEISIARHEGKSYLAIRKAYTKKDGETKTKSAVWVPFNKAKHLPDIIVSAVNEGMKRHYDEEYTNPFVIDR